MTAASNTIIVYISQKKFPKIKNSLKQDVFNYWGEHMWSGIWRCV